MATSPTCVVAYVGEDDRYQTVREAGLNTALASEAKLILFEPPDGSTAKDPIKRWKQSVRGSRPLRPEELEAVGRSSLASHVREARSLGVDAYGWVGRSRGIDDLERCAFSQNADLLVLPTDLEPRLAGWQPQNPAQVAEEEVGHPVVFVRDDEHLATFPPQYRRGMSRTLPRVLASAAGVVVAGLVLYRMLGAIRARNRARRRR